MYDLVPTKELAMESMSWPLTPKSHNLISPLEFTSMFEGLTSVKEKTILKMNAEYSNLTKRIPRNTMEKVQWSSILSKWLRLLYCVQTMKQELTE